MNVVLLPALASSLASAVSDGVFCEQWTCLFGWVWSIAALMLLSAWLTNCWSSGNDNVARRLMPTAGATSTATLVPQLAGLASPTRQPPARPSAVFAAAGLALRGPPTTDMAVTLLLPPAIARRDAAADDGRPSSPSLCPTRSTGTPCPPACDDAGGSGQPSPV